MRTPAEVKFWKLWQTHTLDECRWQICVVHNPSDHHLRSWPLHLRHDTGRVERTCPHGIGHPDPDDLLYWRSVTSDDEAYTLGIHGCDGCCEPQGSSRDWM